MRASAPLLACTGVALAAASPCGCTKRIDHAAAWTVVDGRQVY